MSKLNYSKLTSASDSFSNMMQHFAVVTVMEAKVYEGPSQETLRAWRGADGNDPMQADAIYDSLDVLDPICELKTLKIANVTIEGPDKTITGGRYNNPLIKYGKSARLEMQDALGHADAIDRLCGGVAESETASNWQSSVHALHFGEDFSKVVTIIGDTFFINSATGQQVKAKIIFYQFNPDSIFNLVQDAEGDATVFDMNGDLLTTEIGIADHSYDDDPESQPNIIPHGVFYTILDVADKSMRMDLNTSGVTDPSGKHIVVSPRSILEDSTVTITWTIPENYTFDDTPQVDGENMTISSLTATYSTTVTYVESGSRTFVVTGTVNAPVPPTPTTYTVTLTSDASSHGSWSTSSLTAATQSSTFTPDSGYDAPAESALVVTGTLPSHTYSNGTLTLTSNPVSDATVYAAATPTPVQYSITLTGTNGSWNPSGPLTASGDSSTFEPDSGYMVPDSITTSGTLPAHTYSNGTLTLNGNPTENVTVSATGVVPTPHTITLSATNGAWDVQQLDTINDVATFQPTNGYITPSSINEVIPDGVASYTINSNGYGKLTLLQIPSTDLSWSITGKQRAKVKIQLDSSTMPTGTWGIDTTSSLSVDPDNYIELYTDQLMPIYLYEKVGGNWELTKEPFADNAIAYTSTQGHTYYTYVGNGIDPGFYITSSPGTKAITPKLYDADTITLSLS